MLLLVVVTTVAAATSSSKCFCCSSEYLLASLRNLSANDNELALSMSNKDRCLIVLLNTKSTVSGSSLMSSVVALWSLRVGETDFVVAVCDSNKSVDGRFSVVVVAEATPPPNDGSLVVMILVIGLDGIVNEADAVKSLSSSLLL